MPVICDRPSVDGGVGWEPIGEATLAAEPGGMARWQQLIRIQATTPAEAGQWIARIQPVIRVRELELQAHFALIGNVAHPTNRVSRTQFLGRIQGGANVVQSLQLPDDWLGFSDGVEWKASDDYLQVEVSPKPNVGVLSDARPDIGQVLVRIEVPRATGPFDAWVEGRFGEGGQVVRWRVAGWIYQ